MSWVGFVFNTLTEAGTHLNSRMGQRLVQCLTAFENEETYYLEDQDIVS